MLAMWQQFFPSVVLKQIIIIKQSHTKPSNKCESSFTQKPVFPGPSQLHFRQGLEWFLSTPEGR